MDQIENNYLTPRELLLKFPALTTKLGWTSSILIKFHQSGLLLGYKKKSGCFLHIHSVIALAKVTNKLTNKKSS